MRRIGNGLRSPLGFQHRRSSLPHCLNSELDQISSPHRESPSMLRKLHGFDSRKASIRSRLPRPVAIAPDAREPRQGDSGRAHPLSACKIPAPRPQPSLAHHAVGGKHYASSGRRNPHPLAALDWQEKSAGVCNGDEIGARAVRAEKRARETLPMDISYAVCHWTIGFAVRFTACARYCRRERVCVCTATLLGSAHGFRHLLRDSGT
jgi:hypothetical protein